MNKNITLGKWVSNYEPFKGKNHHILWVEGEGQIAEIITPNKEDVHLIVTCQNACVAINPSNPMAVAENIQTMQQMLGIILRNSKDPQTVAHCRKVLSAIERKE